MRIVLDTNVLVSGIFFGGLPGRLLDAWADGRLELVLSPAILDEYLRVCERLAESRPALEYESVIAAIAGHGVLIADPTWDEPITVDPHDDKFMLCARSTDAVVVSGDSDLLDVSGWEGVQVLKPRDLLDQLPGDSAAVQRIGILLPHPSARQLRSATRRYRTASADSSNSSLGGTPRGAGPTQGLLGWPKRREG